MRESKPVVVLLHGLARRKGSMAGMRRFLEAAGFETWSRTYPSRRQTILDAASLVAEWIAHDLPSRPLVAVTHSMGGILFRHMRDPRLAWQRAVMLAPPNGGSQIAASFSANPLFRWFYGPAGVELADASAWPSPPAPFAVVAGTRDLSIANPTSWTVARRFPTGVRHDGTVATTEAELTGMSAFATVDATHTWIMNDRHARAHVLSFLETGRLADMRDASSEARA
jgi:hypothetical protein